MATLYAGGHRLQWHQTPPMAGKATRGENSTMGVERCPPYTPVPRSARGEVCPPALTWFLRTDRQHLVNAQPFMKPVLGTGESPGVGRSAAHSRNSIRTEDHAGGDGLPCRGQDLSVPLPIVRTACVQM